MQPAPPGCSQLRAAVARLLCCWALLSPVSAQNSAPNSTPHSTPDEQQLQQQLQAIAEQLHTLQQSRVTSNAKLEKLQAELADNAGSSKRIISELDSIGQQLQQLQQQLHGLREREAQQTHELQQQQQQLEEQILQAYRSGRHSRLQLLLNLKDASASSRLLAYQGYLAKQRAAVITSINSQYQTLLQTRRALQQSRTALAASAREQKQLLAALQAQQQTGELLRASIREQLDDIDVQVNELQQNQQQLEQLLKELRDVFADIPEQLNSVAIASQRGKLPWPVAAAKSRISLEFGARREAGITSTGLFIDLPTGHTVHAVSRGRVVFADWLRGYGWLIIIDHGDDYLSLYGNNDRLLQDVGSWVESGQQVAVSGNGFGADMRSGLYFEMRHHGEAFNPRPWLKRQ